jgi:hypothetical protein
VARADAVAAEHALAAKLVLRELHEEPRDGDHCDWAHWAEPMLKNPD